MTTEAKMARLCKVCDLPDWKNPEFLAMLDELDLSFGRERPHRKHWEFAQGMLGLRRLGCLRPDALALGVGGGREHPMYYLANHVRRVHATDIYGTGTFAAGEAPADMLIRPERYAPFPYLEDHLVTQYMSGLELKYPDACFDIAFSFSSIEHFAGHEGAAQAMCEMARVLRPGGVAVVATELLLNDVSHPEFFRPAELEEFVIRRSGMSLVEPVDYTISAAVRDHPLDLATASPEDYPHVVVKVGAAVFTSVLLFFRRS